MDMRDPQLLARFDPTREVPWQEHRSKFWHAGGYWATLQAAQEARRLAASYRGFNVGAAVFAFMEHGCYDVGIRYKIFRGSNVKLYENDAKICAERAALEAARMAGYTFALGVVIVGDAQPDTHSGLVSDTLHPCGLCREYMRASPLIRRKRMKTFIITSTLDERKQELFSLGSLLRAHKNGRKPTT